MKKVLYIFAAVALLLGVASCQKDKDEDLEENNTTQQAGVYNPEMKISRIYVQYEDGEKELEQVWRWKDNKLIEIQYGYERYAYTYQNNRLSRLEVYYGGNLSYTYVYSYEGANFSKWEYYNEGEHEIYEFDYKNGKISSMYAYVDSHQDVHDFTWNGDNVSSSNEYGCLSTYTYDGKNNPYYGSLGFIFGDEPYCVSLSKNNITREYHNGQLGGILYEFTYEYTYEYNSKGYPVKRIKTESVTEPILDITYTDTSIYYYEYLED